ncbi:4Fe-4S binding protein [Methanobacterium movens]
MSKIERKGKETRCLEHRNSKCLGCGICVDICPTNALRTGPLLPIARGILQGDLVAIDNNKCCLCGLCASACPFDALKFTIDGENSRNMDMYPKWNHSSEIDEETCIYCGKCSTACPRDAIFMNRTLPDRKELVSGETEVNQDKCIFCGMCEESCPADAINIEKINPDSSNPSIGTSTKINESKCIYCSICRRICPQDAIKIVCTTCMYSDEIPDPQISGNIVMDEEKCINCSWCQEICPVEAAHITKPFSGEIFFEEEFECKGDSCHACADVCSCNAISMVDNHSYINPQFCVLCGACSRVCPQKGISIKRKDLNLTNVRSKAWNARFSSLKS